MTDHTRENQRCLMICTGSMHLDGGIAAVNRLVIRAIADAGYELDVLALNETDASVDARYISPDRIRYRVFREDKWRFTLAVWNALRKRQYSFVFVDHVNLASVLVPARLVAKVRYCVWLCGIEVVAPRPNWEGRIGLEHAWKRVAISDFTRASVLQRFPHLPIEVCDLALDPIRHVATLPAEPPEIQSGARLALTAVNGVTAEVGPQAILHVGRMSMTERYKGQESLLQAFPKIRSYFPDAQLIYVGQGDNLLNFKAIAQSLPLEIQRGVFMPGYVNDEMLDQLYRNCYLFAMPSTGEGFGLVYLEAMSRAKPCVGGSLDATPCVIRDGVTGLLVEDPKSPEQVAAAIIWLLSHPTEARKMGVAGYELVRSYYLYDQFRDRFWDVVMTK